MRDAEIAVGVWGTEHYSVCTSVGSGRLSSEVKVVEVEELGR